MAKAEIKTRPTDVKAEDFLNTIDDAQKREDSFTVMQIMSKLSGDEPRMWGPAIVGFGSSMLKYANGHELEWPKLAFSPRQAGLTLYFADDFAGEYHELLGKLGKHTTSKCCLYIKRLSDVDRKVLTQLIKASLKPVKSGGSSIRATR
ncbi:MAG: DUF1801 domain-containing protein [Pyrinomonadaceae bacterium]